MSAHFASTKVAFFQFFSFGLGGWVCHDQKRKQENLIEEQKFNLRHIINLFSNLTTFSVKRVQLNRIVYKTI